MVRRNGQNVRLESSRHNIQRDDAEPRPYALASFVAAVSGSILASIGVESLGLGPLDSPTLGSMIYWNIFNSSVLLGLWYWLLPPIVV